TLAVLVVVPLGALLSFGFVLATDVKHLAIGVLDASATPSSRRLVADLAASGTFDLHPVRTRDDITRALVGGRIRGASVIPPDYERDLTKAASGGAPPQVQVIYDGGEAVLAGNAEAFVRALVAATGIATAPPAHGADGIDVTTRALFNPRL